MPIQWFPGHMHLTRQAIADRVKAIDVVIEMLDARLPGSSANPLLEELTQHKPKLKLLNKQDLADIGITAQWLAHYNAQSGTRAIGLDASEAAPAQKLIDASRSLVPNRGGMAKPVRVMVCGVPNVGKSTLVNSLMNKRAAKTGDEAGITKIEQRIALASDFYLYDTPGMLWPRIAIEQSGLNLAASGAVGRNAYDEHEVALGMLGYLKMRYAAKLNERYGIGDAAAAADEDLLDAIGRKRSALRRGGQIDAQKASEALINDFRSGSLGRVSLESPEEFLAWKSEADRLDALRELAKKRALDKKRGVKKSSGDADEA